VSVSVASEPEPQPTVSRLLLTVNAIVWLDVADGRGSERISLREETCMPAGGDAGASGVSTVLSDVKEVEKLVVVVKYEFYVYPIGG